MYEEDEVKQPYLLHLASLQNIYNSHYKFIKNDTI